MEKEIQEIIKKSLPEHVGKELKKRLEQADEDALTVKDQAEEISELTIMSRTQDEIIDKYKSLDARNNKLDAREDELDTKEKGLEVSILKVQLEAEKTKTAHSTAVALGLVRNTNYRTEVYNNQSTMGHTDLNGNWVDPTNESKSNTEQKTAD